MTRMRWDRCRNYPSPDRGVYRIPKARAWYHDTTNIDIKLARPPVCPEPTLPLPTNASRPLALWELQDAYKDLAAAKQRVKARTDGASAVTKAEWRIEQARRALRGLE